MYCTRCGTQMEDTTKYCPNCGECMIEPEVGASNNQKLMACDACGHMVSVDAEMCPSCGHKTVKGKEQDRFREQQQQQRAEAVARSQAEQTLEQRKIIKIVISIISTLMFFYGIYLLAKNDGIHWYMMTEWGIVSDTASLALVLLLVASIMDIVNLVSYQIAKNNCKSQIRQTTWTPPNLSNNAKDNVQKEENLWICPECSTKVKLSARTCPNCGHSR